MSPANNGNCGTTSLPRSFGVSYGGNADAGAGYEGISATGSAGAGVFYNGNTGASTGAFAGGGATAYFFNGNIGAPKQQGQPFNFGGYAGVGPSVWISNAGGRLFLSEVRPGTMSSEQYCMLVFANRRFHVEKPILRLGKDRDRKVYEGTLSQEDWGTLDGILESDPLRKLHVRASAVPPVVPDAHALSISVAREETFQNMDFIDNKSRKPYELQLKPLLEWWKTARSRRMVPSEAPPDHRCELDSVHGVFAY